MLHVYSNMMAELYMAYSQHINLLLPRWATGTPYGDLTKTGTWIDKCIHVDNLYETQLLVRTLTSAAIWLNRLWKQNIDYIRVFRKYWKNGRIRGSESFNGNCFSDQDWETYMRYEASIGTYEINESETSVVIVLFFLCQPVWFVF